MTEQEWLNCTDPMPMLDFLEDKASDRKSRLYGTACCRRIWPLLAHDTHRRAVERAEQFADGLTTLQKLESASRSAARHRDNYRTEYDQMTVSPRNVVFSAAQQHGRCAASDAGSDAYWVVKFWGHLLGIHKESEEENKAHLIRDIFGNPFRPTPFASACLTSAVKQLAQAAYEDRILPSGELDPARLSILADALEEVGADTALLDHLRGPCPHTRGCWPLDLILGRE
jgi:hypothetical protein